jgi:D-galactarolactone cycloisomerase
LLEVKTSDGLIGLGEPSPYVQHVKEMQSLCGELASAVVGYSVDEAWELTAQDQVLAGCSTRHALIAGLSHALFDISGKMQGKPCWHLLQPPGREADKGQADREVLVYASGGMLYEDQPLELLVEEALAIKERGYTAWKFRPPVPRGLNHYQRAQSPPAIDGRELLEISRKIRSAVGNGFELMVDFGCRIESVDTAASICDGLDELDFLFVEEPIRRDPEMYTRLTNLTRMKVAAGETFCGYQQVEDWVGARRVDIVQPDMNWIGFNDGMKIIAAASELNLTCVPHNWANAVSNAANFHFSAALGKHCPYVEYSVAFNPLRNELVTEPFVPTQGKVRLGATPGLGVDLDHEAVKRFKIT